jgi:sugar transferase (PEP-CTERM system associated)
LENINVVTIFGHFVSRSLLFLGASEALVCAVGGYAIASLISGSWPAHLQFQPRAIIFSTLAFVASSVAIGLYEPRVVFERRYLLRKTLVAALVALPVVFLVLRWVSSEDTWGLLVKLPVAWLICILLTRVAFVLAVRSKMLTRRVVVIGACDRAAKVVDSIQSGRGGSLEVVRVITPAADAGEWLSRELAPEKLHREGIWGIIIVSADRHALAAPSLLRCKLDGIRVLDEHRYQEQERRRIDIEALDIDRLLIEDGFSRGWTTGTIKRLMDLIIGSALLLLTLPLMLIVAVLIKVDSPGPVFYRQERVGFHGKRFALLKFRSMQQDAEAACGPCWAAEQDCRVTRVGSLIRHARIDELPQLVNVLRGEMSLVGPRPERPYFVEQLAAAIPFYEERHNVKPGITGWAQVSYSYGRSVEDAREKLCYDLYYVKRRTMFLDLVILMSTLRVVLFPESAR